MDIKQAYAGVSNKRTGLNSDQVGGWVVGWEGEGGMGYQKRRCRGVARRQQERWAGFIWLLGWVAVVVARNLRCAGEQTSWARDATRRMSLRRAGAHGARARPQSLCPRRLCPRWGRRWCWSASSHSERVQQATAPNAMPRAKCHASPHTTCTPAAFAASPHTTCIAVAFAVQTSDPHCMAAVSAAVASPIMSRQSVTMTPSACCHVVSTLTDQHLGRRSFACSSADAPCAAAGLPVSAHRLPGDHRAPRRHIGSL